MIKSKAKFIKKPILGIVVLGLVGLCSVASAQTSRTKGDSTATTTDEVSVTAMQTTTGKKDLSELGVRLKNRLSEVWKEAVQVFNDETQVSENKIELANDSAQVLPSPFIDVQNNSEKYFIDTLASHGIIKGNNQKFYPDNYMRLGDFIKVLVDTYRVKVGYTSNFDVSSKEFTPSSVGTDMNVFLSTRMIHQLFTSLEHQFPGMIKDINLEISDLYVKRDKASKYVVQWFDLTPNEEEFIDINSSPYRTSITRLAQLNIINSQTQKFYPDNYLRKYEFTLMLANTLAYAPSINDAERKNLVTYLTVTQKGENDFMNKYEVYTILSEVTDTKMSYDETKADHQRMTRGDFASILVQAFDLNSAVKEPTPQEQSSSTWDTKWPSDISLLLQIKSLLSQL